MQRFPQIDLEAVMAAHDIPMHIIERPTADGALLMYPLNAAADVGYGDYLARQGLPLAQYIAQPEFVPFFEHHYAPVMQHGVASFTYEVIFPNVQGEMRTYRSTIYRVNWSPDYATGLVITLDITAQRAAEEQLRAIQTQLQTVIANVPMVLYTVDTKGIFTLSEGQGLASLGLVPGQVVGMSLFDLYHDQPLIIADARRALAGETVVSVHDIAEVRFEGRLTPLWSEDGVVSGVLGVAIDITARLSIEQERLALQEEFIAAQNAALAELSTPLIPLSDAIVVMPLIGLIDSQRAQRVLETLLYGLTEGQAQYAILDITGVPLVDTQVANALLHTAQAVKLLGAQLILTGIRSEVAQTLVGLGVDLAGIITRSTLQSGIAYATARMATADRDS